MMESTNAEPTRPTPEPESIASDRGTVHVIVMRSEPDGLRWLYAAAIVSVYVAALAVRLALLEE